MAKVLLLNGSPHRNGCVFTALSEVGKALNAAGVETEFFHIGTKPVRGCIACWQCSKPGATGCVFKDDICHDLVEAMRPCDGIVIGSPVYYAGPAGSLCALLDRAFFSGNDAFAGKLGACVVNCRRGGASAAFDRLNKYFTICRMPVVSSQYWNSTHGRTVEDILQDAEGLQTMRTLGTQMAYELRARAALNLPPPPQEPITFTDFIRH